MEWRSLRAERHTVDHGPVHYCNLTEDHARLKNLARVQPASSSGWSCPGSPWTTETSPPVKTPHRLLSVLPEPDRIISSDAAVAVAWTH